MCPQTAATSGDNPDATSSSTNPAAVARELLATLRARRQKIKPHQVNPLPWLAEEVLELMLASNLPIVSWKTAGEQRIVGIRVGEQETIQYVILAPLRDGNIEVRVRLLPEFSRLTGAAPTTYRPENTSTKAGGSIIRTQQMDRCSVAGTTALTEIGLTIDAIVGLTESQEH